MNMDMHTWKCQSTHHTRGERKFELRKANKCRLYICSKEGLKDRNRCFSLQGAFLEYDFGGGGINILEN